MEEKGKGKFQLDFEKSKARAEGVFEGLRKRYSWIKSFRWKGDIGFKGGRKKETMRKLAEAGEEISFGLDMKITLVDTSHREIEVDALIRWHKEPFYDIILKSYKDNPTIEDFVDQMKDIWIILASGGTPEKPKAFVVTKFGEYPKACFKDMSVTKNPGRFKIAFYKVIKWKPVNYVSLLGETIETEFEKMRR